ncbi:MAG: ArsI/CadI family heavy metal resistance metalloenzyme [Phormidium sp.]
MAINKTHVSLNVSDINKSVTFYQAMFGISPVKYKADYAKFDIANPPLNLTLQLSSNIKTGGTLSHLGVQVESSQDVQSAIARFKAAGLTLFEEKDTNCCYALQDKVWVTDPDGNKWEIFVVKVADTAPEENIGTVVNSALKVTTPPCCG